MSIPDCGAKVGLGAILRHKTLAMATCSNLYGLELPDDGILMSYLPLAHIYEVGVDYPS